MNNEFQGEFLSIIKKDDELIKLLKIVRELNLSDSYIGAGAARNLIWDSLHGHAERTSLNDVDVVYFDSGDILPEKDLEIWRKLCEIEPNVEWNVFNQARAYIKNKLREAINSTEESVATWPETPTCIGLRMNKDDSFDICAPYGIDDLMGLIVRPAGDGLRDLELYKKRIFNKKWKETWPKLEIFY